MTTVRDLHTATLLPNGKTLVAGGFDGTNYLSSAELYDPATETWSSTGSLTTVSAQHTSTLLPSGQILVAGGFFNSHALTSAELYEPAAGGWSGTGNMTMMRVRHTATLLPNGKVLVAGGYDADFNALIQAELYDPATGTWSTTGNMTTARVLQQATLLPSGKVLVEGGNNSNGTSFLTDAELYDPAAGTWSNTGSMTTARDQHTATLLANGKVLVAGGFAGGFLTSTELYDPGTETWSNAGHLITGRDGHTATLLPNGQVLVVGGAGNGGTLASAELYDPVAGTWSSTGGLATGRFEHTATLLPSGKVLVAGGFSSTTDELSSAELYNPVTGTWSSTGSLTTRRAFPTSALLPNGKVLVAGGDDGIELLSSADLYDPATGTCSSTGDMSTARELDTATLLPHGEVLIAGGEDSTNVFASAELYDVGLGFDPSWQPQITGITSPLGYGSALSLTGSLFRGISGASDGNTQDSSTNYPLVQLRSIEGSQSLFLLADPNTGWSDTSFTSLPIGFFPLGHWLATVFTNGIPSSSAIVSVTKGNPVVSGQASGGMVGGNIFDQVTLTGGFNPSGTVTFTLYGPTDGDCSKTAIFTSTKTLDGNGQATSDSYTTTKIGTYHWVVTYSGDANNNPVATVCGDPSQTVTVTQAAPSLTILASSNTVVIGSHISSSATLSGGLHPTGSITFNLYGPGDANCSGAAAFSVTVPINDNGTYDSGLFTPVLAGTYHWTASYSGDASNTATATVCSDPNGTVVVTAAVPSLTILVSAKTIKLGANTSSSATLSGAFGPTGTITFNLYGPNDTSCSGAAVFTVALPVTHNGTYQSGPFTPILPGTYHWTATYSGDANNTTVATVCSDPNGTVTVTGLTPTLTILASSNTVEIGGSVSSSATLSNGKNPTGTITFDLYGPDDNSCTGAAVFTATVPITGNGTYHSGSFIPTLAGTYHWTATYSGDANNTTTATVCSDPNGTVTVTQLTPTLTILASSNTIGIGSSISSSATLGNGTNPTGTITFNLYGPDDTSCSGAAVFTATVPITGNGTYHSGPFTPTLAGTYHWTATYSGDVNNTTVATVCSDPKGTVVITPDVPSLTTQPSAGVTLGGSIFDSATLGNGVNATGTMTFHLYGPNDGTCGGKVVFTSTVTVTGNKTYQSASFTPSVAGTYYWTVTYSGDANNQMVSTNCSDATDVTVVVAPPHVGNLSARGNVGVGDDVMIGGFIITGTSPRQVVVRGIGPSTGVPGALADPLLELHGPTGFTTIINDNWQDASNSSQIPAELQPKDPNESAILVTLNPGAYTGIVRGANNTTGVALVETYDLGTAPDSQLANTSTRASVGTQDNVLIGGFITTGSANSNIVVRAIGPSLLGFGVTNPLSDPVISVFDQDGSLITSNDNWQDDPNSALVSQAGLAPTNPLESALYLNVAPKAYTAIVSGAGNTTGVGLVEIYSLP